MRKRLPTHGHCAGHHVGAVDGVRDRAQVAALGQRLVTLGGRPGEPMRHKNSGRRQRIGIAHPHIGPRFSRDQARVVHTVNDRAFGRHGAQGSLGNGVVQQGAIDENQLLTIGREGRHAIGVGEQLGRCHRSCRAGGPASGKSAVDRAEGQRRGRKPIAREPGRVGDDPTGLVDLPGAAPGGQGFGGHRRLERGHHIRRLGMGRPSTGTPHDKGKRKEAPWQAKGHADLQMKWAAASDQAGRRSS